MYTAMKNDSQDATLFIENELHMELFNSADLFPGRSVNENTDCTLSCASTDCSTSPAPNACYLHILQVPLTAVCDGC